jgi:hypothetical protein
MNLCLQLSMLVAANAPGHDPGVEPRGTKRRLETGECDPTPNYVVYTYVPGIVDVPHIHDFRCQPFTRLTFKCFACKEPLTEEGILCPSCSEEQEEELPNVTCTGCKATLIRAEVHLRVRQKRRGLRSQR